MSSIAESDSILSFKPTTTGAADTAIPPNPFFSVSGKRKWSIDDDSSDDSEEDSTGLTTTTTTTTTTSSRTRTMDKSEKARYRFAQDQGADIEWLLQSQDEDNAEKIQLNQIRLLHELSQQDKEDFQVLHRLIKRRRIFVIDEEYCTLMDASSIVPYKNGFLLTLPR